MRGKKHKSVSGQAAEEAAAETNENGEQVWMGGAETNYGKVREEAPKTKHKRRT